MEQAINFKDFAKLIFNDESLSSIQIGTKIHLKNLINIINRVNFKDEVIFVNFKHSLYGNLISVPVKPLPCFSNVLNCSWINFKLKKLKSYQFLNIFISDGFRLIVFKPEVKNIDEEGLTFLLPELGYDLNRRGVKRYLCREISAEILQSGLVYYGEVTDFNGEAFCVKLLSDSYQEIQYTRFSQKPTVIIKRNGDLLFSGECFVVRKDINSSFAKVVFKPSFDCIQRYKKKQVRSIRQRFLPSPTIIFKHPIIDKLVTLKIDDLSSSGLSVEELYSDSLLMPGLIIPQVELEFTPGFSINCKAQVLYRKILKIDDEHKLARCGVAFTEMEIADQIKLSSFLHRSIDEKSYICNRVDMDALWDFFFETGFFYAEKYALLYANKKKIKDIYEKLYSQNPNVARHFIYQDKGKILAHISTLRAYEKTWLIHHHASLKLNIKTAGQIILRQLGIHMTEFRHMNSNIMQYVICIYRPENKFPRRVFGGFAEYVNDKSICSVDSFAYFYYKKEEAVQYDTLNPLVLLGWKLTKVDKEDLLEFENFYRNHSGGLLVKALHLHPDEYNINSLKATFEKLGFKYDRKLFALKKEEELVAIFDANITDVGLNLSNFTNSIKLYVLNPELLDPRVLNFSLHLISKNYDQDEIPVMVYPLNYFEKHPINFNRKYDLWILDMKYSDVCLKYLEDLFLHKHSTEKSIGNNDDK